VSPIDRLVRPLLHELGTRTTPAGLREPQETEEISEKRDSEKSETASADDTPVLTRQQSQTIDILAEKLDTLALPTFWPNKTPILAPMATQVIARSNVQQESGEGGGSGDLGDGAGP
jgi:hypothetical protein